MTDASIRKMRRMSPSLPPMAFMIPISRVRSRIDITIVLTMPSDETASAMEPNQAEHDVQDDEGTLGPRSASFSEKALKPISLILSSTSCVNCARFTLTVSEL